MKVYIAARTTDLHRVRQVEAIVEGLGHEITFKWWGSEGEIRTDLAAEDLEIVDEPIKGVPGPPGWNSTITHVPTGTAAAGVGLSKVQAHDAAMKTLRASLNAGWSSAPERAAVLGQRERQACWDADAAILCVQRDILGAAIEFGMLVGDEKPVIIFGQIERDTPFYYLPNVILRTADWEELGIELDRLADR